MKQSALAIVIPAYNEEKTLLKTLEAVTGQELSCSKWKLIIVDNGSTDATSQIAKQFIADHKQDSIDLLNEPVKGTGAACRAGFDYAIKNGATIVARTDADCIPHKGWLRWGMDYFKDDSVHMVAGKTEPIKDKHFRSNDEFLFRYGMPMMRSLIALGRMNFDAYNFAQGNNMFIRSDAYQSVGGFIASDIATSDEDIDLSEKIMKRYGRKSLVQAPDVIVGVSMRRIRRLGWIKAIAHHVFGHHVQRLRSRIDVR